MRIADLRAQYHEDVCQQIIRTSGSGKWQYPNFADGNNASSRAIAQGIVAQLPYTPNDARLDAQTVGNLFEILTKQFLDRAFQLLRHLRPGEWYYSTQTAISAFDQYEHLADLQSYIKKNKELTSAFRGDYIITPDIVIGRYAVPDEEINANESLIDIGSPIATHTPLRQANYNKPRPCLILHASISCKWTIRSDRVQNSRTEALNLVRNRKGNLPHIVAVTAEPLPTRLASLALGTGDLDCVYHFALNELWEAIVRIDNKDQFDMLKTLVDGRRLRDISDLPFDLAI